MDEYNIKLKSEGCVVRIEVKEEKTRYDVLPKAIRDKYLELNFDINHADKDGFIKYFTFMESEKEDYLVDLDYVLEDKGIKIEYIGENGDMLHDQLLSKLNYSKDQSRHSDYLFDYLDTYFETYNSWTMTLKRLHKRLSEDEAIMFFTEYVDKRPKFKKVFKVMSLDYRQRDYTNLVKFNSVTGPINFVTMYQDEVVPDSGFIIGKDFSWIYYFGNFRLYVYSEFEQKKDIDGKECCLHYGIENRR